MEDGGHPARPGRRVVRSRFERGAVALRCELSEWPGTSHHPRATDTLRAKGLWAA